MEKTSPKTCFYYLFYKNTLSKKSVGYKLSVEHFSMIYDFPLSISRYLVMVHFRRHKESVFNAKPYPIN